MIEEGRALNLAPELVRPLLHQDYSGNRTRLLSDFVSNNFRYGWSLNGRSWAINYEHRETACITNPNDAIVLVESTLPLRGRERWGHPPFNVFEPMTARKVSDKVYTQIPQALIDKLGEPLDLGLINNGILTCQAKSQILCGRTGTKVRDVTEMANSNIMFDTISSISMVDPALDIAIPILAKLAAHTEKIKTIRIKNMYRGRGAAAIELVEQSANQVAVGGRFFLVKFRIATINQHSSVWEHGELISLMIMSPAEKILKFAKSRNMIAEFQEQNGQNADKYLRPEEWKAKIKEQAANVSKYWAGLYEAIPPTKVNYSSLPSHNRVDEILTKKEHIGNEVYHVIGLESAIKSSAAGRKFERFQASLEVAIGIKDQAATKKRQLLRQKKQIEGTIAEYNRLLKEYEVSLETMPGKIEAHEAKVSNAKEAVDTLTPLRSQKKKEYNDAITTMRKDGSFTKIDWFENLKKSGIVVIDATYASGRTKKSARAHPEVVSTPGWTLVKIHFVTTKPSIIYVDRASKGKDAKQVVAGPYEVIIDGSGGYGINFSLRLASINSVFGMKRSGSNYICKIHPHTGTFTLAPTAASIKQSFEQWTNPCLGDAVGAIRQGFDKNDIRIAVNGAIAWIQSANSRDAWGRTYTMFPKPSEVDFDGKFLERLDQPDAITTIAGMTDLAEAVHAVISEPVPTEPESTLEEPATPAPAVIPDGPAEIIVQALRNIVTTVEASVPPAEVEAIEFLRAPPQTTTPQEVEAFLLRPAPVMPGQATEPFQSQEMQDLVAVIMNDTSIRTVQILDEQTIDSAQVVESPEPQVPQMTEVTVTHVPTETTDSGYTPYRPPSPPTPGE